MKKGSYKDYADLLRQLDTKRLAKGKQLFSLTGSYNRGQKSLGQYCNIHFFLSFLGSLIKQCILFEIFLQFSPQPIQSWNSENNSGYTRPTLFVGWGEGLDLCELENAEEMQKYPKTFVHDCSCLGWTMEADSPHREQASVGNCLRFLDSSSLFTRELSRFFFAQYPSANLSTGSPPQFFPGLFLWKAMSFIENVKWTVVTRLALGRPPLLVQSYCNYYETHFYFIFFFSSQQ